MSDRFVKLMCESIGLPIIHLERLIERSPYTYKVYPIPKRSGGSRMIAQPARETKVIQRLLLEKVFPILPVHESATAYRCGSSIKNNARIHKDSKYLVKFDFKNFFPSIKRSDLIMFLSNHLSDDFDEDDIARIATISSFQPAKHAELCLSVGAPSSPLLANAIMYDFDVVVSAWCVENEISYSRYADDLAFSTNLVGVSSQIENMVMESIEKIAYPRLSLNDDKTTHLSRKHRRRVTGLILNNEGQISIGRSRKREISALIHKFSLNLLTEDEKCRLQGLLGFARDVEPLFVLSMDRKYGNELLVRIFKHRKNSEKPVNDFFENLFDAI